MGLVWAQGVKMERGCGYEMMQSSEIHMLAHNFVKIGSVAVAEKIDCGPAKFEKLIKIAEKLHFQTFNFTYAVNFF